MKLAALSVRIRFAAFCWALLPICAVSAVQSIAAAEVAPIVLYTDLASGPNNGGEDNKGVYLSIFGKNFGTDKLGTWVRVYLNDAEVAQYRYLGPSKGRPDIQQITVQIGAVGNPVAGKPLPVKVVAGDKASNTDVTFTVWPGNIYFVDNVKGVDSDNSAAAGTILHPFKSVQKKSGARLGFAIDPVSVSGAWGRVRAGDFIIMRGSGSEWTDVGFGGYFLQALNKSGCPIGVNCPQGGGSSSGPITLMAYPGEDVHILNAYNPALDVGAISSADSARIGQGMGSWMTLANLRIEGGNHDGVINTQAGGSYWRVVNNDLTAASAVNNAAAKAGGIAGSGKGQLFLGNRIHDVYCGPARSGPLQNHGVYLDGEGSYEIAYNLIERIPGGNGIQVYVNRGQMIDGVSIHHNLIREAGKHGINVADGSRRGISIYNNIVIGSEIAAIRFNSSLLEGARISNNTFWITDRGSVGGQRAALMNDAILSSSALEFQNNIVVPAGGSRNYIGGSAGFGSVTGGMAHNLWHGGKSCLINLPFGNRGCPIGNGNVNGDPRFVSTQPGQEDLRLQAGSPAIAAGSQQTMKELINDFDLMSRRRDGKPVDIGAYAYSR
jgi:hypothetical protein